MQANECEKKQAEKLKSQAAAKDQRGEGREKSGDTDAEGGGTACARKFTENVWGDNGPPNGKPPSGG